MELFTKKMSWTVLRDILRDKKDFKNNGGTFRGSSTVPDSIGSMGVWLDEDVRKGLNFCLKKNTIDYIVWSWNTPLYAHCGGFWIEVPHSHDSKSTMAHRNKMKTAVSQL